MFEPLFARAGLSLERLRTLCEVAVAGGIAKAAPGDPDRQSLFSRQIRELESFFGVELLRRRGRGIEITPTGERIAQAARAHFHELENILGGSRPDAVGFHIAAANSILEWVVPPRLARSKALAGVKFRFSDMRSADIVRALRDHRVDFGIVRSNTVAHPLRAKSMGSFGYRVFVPGRAKPKEIEGLPWALSAGIEFREAIHRATAAAGTHLDVAFECQSFGQGAALVQQGVARSILPDFAAPYLKGCVVSQAAWLTDYTRELCLVWRDRIEDLRPTAIAVSEALLDPHSLA